METKGNIYYCFSIRWKGQAQFYATWLFKSIRKAVQKANDAPCEVRIRKIRCSCAQDLISQKLISEQDMAFAKDHAAKVWCRRGF